MVKILENLSHHESSLDRWNMGALWQKVGDENEEKTMVSLCK